jgi:membrane-bound lytic murein transglycosylase A
MTRTASRLGAVLFASLMAACATTGKPPAVTAAAPRPPVLALKAATFADLPGWSETDPSAALAAFQRSCAVVSQRAPGTPLGASAKYGGTVEQWMPACAAAMTTQPAGARAFFEQYFQPYEVTDEGDGERKLTGYYEPIFEARHAPEIGFEQPIAARPADLVQIDLGAFAKAYNSPPDTNLKGVIWGKVEGKRIVPFPERAKHVLTQGEVLAYAHPADVYDLQVQGSARLNFPGEPPMRAGYAAQNGWKWNSIYKVLRDRNQIPPDQLNKATVRAWMDKAGPAAVQDVLYQDPSEVFFTLEPIPDPSLGPKGAQGIPLTAQGSMAVDPAFHPYGAVIFIDGTGPDAALSMGPFRRLVVAQDTGGAIRKGPLRGDVFFGSGEGALQGAQRMNAPARWWTLLPSGQAALVAGLSQPTGGGTARAR